MRKTFILLFLLTLQAAAAGPTFDTQHAMETIRHLSVSIGVRHGGTGKEHDAAHYLESQLKTYGYSDVHEVPFPLPNGLTSQDVWVDKPGDTDHLIVVGGHMDSRNDAPGANDNASGAAVVLELARIMQNVHTHDTIRFMFFGTEEIIDTTHPDGHHFGSRYYVSHLSDAEKERIDGMIAVDAVANGSMFVIGNIEGGSPLARSLRKDAVALGYPVLDQTDPGWSDHEAFEEQNIPVAYVRWRIDNHLHTRFDTMQYVHPEKVAIAGRVVLAALRKL